MSAMIAESSLSSSVSGMGIPPNSSASSLPDRFKPCMEISGVGGRGGSICDEEDETVGRGGPKTGSDDDRGGGCDEEDDTGGRGGPKPGSAEDRGGSQCDKGGVAGGVGRPKNTAGVSVLLETVSSAMMSGAKANIVVKSKA